MPKSWREVFSYHELPIIVTNSIKKQFRKYRLTPVMFPKFLISRPILTPETML
jgi:hypothetical protein